LKWEYLEIVDTKPSIIPTITIITARNEKIELTFEVSEKFGISYKKGEKIFLEFSREKIKPSSSFAFCGKTTLFSIKEEKDNSKVYLFSSGGFIIRLVLRQELQGLNITEDYFFCIDKH
jgi:hypothetical protein